MVEKILSVSAFVVALFVVLGLLVSVLYSWIGRRTARAIDAAACDLGLAPAGGGRSDEAAAGVYEGVIEGVVVRMASAWRFVRPIASRYAAYVSEVRVRAALPRPLSFRMEIRRRGVAMPRTLTLLDREFDRVCAIVTDDAEAARDVLAPPELRREIRSFLQSRVRVSRISSESVDTTVFDAHTKGASALSTRA